MSPKIRSPPGQPPTPARFIPFLKTRLSRFIPRLLQLAIKRGYHIFLRFILEIVLSGLPHVACRNPSPFGVPDMGSISFPFGQKNIPPYLSDHHVPFRSAARGVQLCSVAPVGVPDTGPSSVPMVWHTHSRLECKGPYSSPFPLRTAARGVPSIPKIKCCGLYSVSYCTWALVFVSPLDTLCHLQGLTMNLAYLSPEKFSTTCLALVDRYVPLIMIVGLSHVTCLGLPKSLCWSVARDVHKFSAFPLRFPGNV